MRSETKRKIMKLIATKKENCKKESEFSRVLLLKFMKKIKRMKNISF